MPRDSRSSPYDIAGFQTLGGNQPAARFGDKPLTYAARPARDRLKKRTPPRPPQAPANRASIEDVRAGKTALVTGFNSEAQQSSIGNLFQAPIAGLSSGAVAQKGAKFASVTDTYGSGETVPNLADKRTKEAFNRYFAPNRAIGGDIGANYRGVTDAQQLRDQDPTRIAFQNQFFDSETLKDVNDLTPTDLLFRQKELEKRDT